MMQLIGSDQRFMDCFMVLQGIDPEAMGKKGGEEGKE